MDCRELRPLALKGFLHNIALKKTKQGINVLYLEIAIVTRSINFKKRKQKKILLFGNLCILLVIAGSVLSPFVNSSEIVLCVGEDYHISYEYAENENCCSGLEDYSNSNCIQLKQDEPFETNCLDIQLVAIDFGQNVFQKQCLKPMTLAPISSELGTQSDALIPQINASRVFLQEPQFHLQLYTNISTIRLLI